MNPCRFEPYPSKCGSSRRFRVAWTARKSARSSTSGMRSRRGVRSFKDAFPSQPEASSSVTSRSRVKEGLVGHGWLSGDGFSEHVDRWVHQAVDADGCTFGE